ncbi:hypothetical protein [uncultured Fusobacterium sp.]|jgi:hypothetical protein|uniref:hypothetical protein n=1 Tax=uncultured Fusobacterium sp. TaxID=159267 RepID=UPI0025DE7569|nr:hypothetical protein [uncultured Fusobacterium sp.]MCF2640206.1 hypothetical protein [Fusobacterium varium]
MLKFGENIKNVITTDLEKNGLTNGKEIQNWITNKYLTLVIELSSLSDSRVQGILNKNFNDEELKLYSKNYLDREMVNGFEREQVRRISQKTGVNNDERKSEYKRRVKELTELVLKMIDGDIEAYKEFLKKYEEYAFDKEEIKNKGMQKFIPMGIMISLSRNQENPLNLKNIDKMNLKNLNYITARHMVSNIRYEVGCLLGLRKRRKDTTELIDSFKQIVEDSAEVEEEVEESLESIKLERDQYKSSLKLIQKSLDELSEKLKEETQNIASEQIRDFFVSLNSAKYGNFLDKIPLTEELLKDIRKNDKDFDIPQEVKRVLIFIKSVIKFIKDQGITPMQEINRVFEGTAEDIAEMDYVGEEFIDDEVKKLRVIAPGYKYKDLIISIPKVEEVDE